MTHPAGSNVCRSRCPPDLGLNPGLPAEQLCPLPLGECLKLYEIEFEGNKGTETHGM